MHHYVKSRNYLIMIELWIGVLDIAGFEIFDVTKILLFGKN